MGRGHPVIATTISQAEADELAQAHPELLTAKLDITDAADRRQVEVWQVDVLVNNAGLGQVGPLRSIPLDRVRHVFDTDVFGTLAMSQAVIPQMLERGSGRILIVSSVAGVVAGPFTGPYSMTKHALQAMGSALRAELAPAGIDVALVNPGPFATGLQRPHDRRAGRLVRRRRVPGRRSCEFHEGARQRITVNQLDPAEVALRIADLVEADSTELLNLVPPDILARMGLDKPHSRRCYGPGDVRPCRSRRRGPCWCDRADRRRRTGQPAEAARRGGPGC